MGVGAVTVNGVDLTAKADVDEFVIEFQANRLNGVTKFKFKDDHLAVGGSAIDIREQYELIVTDGGTRIFGGRIATLEPAIEGNTIYWTGSAVQFDTLLDERVIDSGLRDTSLNRYDDDDVRWIIGFHAELLANTYVSRLRTLVLPTIDYTGKTLRQALEMLSSYTTGPVYWVDENKQTHWTNPSSAQVIVNPSFDSGSGSSWALDGSAVVTADVGPGSTGDYALVTTGNGSGSHESTQTVTGVVAGKRYYFGAWLYSSVASKAQVRLDWQNVSSVSQRIDVLTNSGTAGAWAAYKGVYTAPATATKVVIRIGGVSNFTGTVRHDNLALVQETAAWGVDTTPDNSTTFAPWEWREPRKAVVPINRVFVQGVGISGWREHAASIAYYGGKKFEGYVSDDRVTTTDGIDSRAAATFRKYAFPARSGSYLQKQSGLVAGTWQIVNIAPLSQTTIEWIATLKVRFGGASLMLYEVIYGEPEEDLGAGLLAAQSAYTGTSVTPNVPDSVIAGLDTSAPATPTGLSVSAVYAQTVDGTQFPSLAVSWTANADADLDAYELAYDKATQGPITYSASASGTGGGLAAGQYAVQVTGNGAVAGETGTTAPPIKVTVSAGQRLFVNITAKAGMASYKVYASILSGNESQPKLTTLTALTTTGSNVEITAAGAGAYPPSSSTALTFLNPQVIRTRLNSITIDDVAGGVYYGLRLRAIDFTANYSGWTAVQTVTALRDNAAPAIPSGLVAVPGFKMVGLSWSRNSEPDLARYQVRYAPASGGGPDTTAWVRLSALSTIAIISGLSAGTTYYFQVRAIDASNNVVTSSVDSTPVDADANPEAGWSNTAGSYVTAVPTLVGAADVSFNSVLTNILSANLIDAGAIQTGTLSVGGTPGTPDFIIVYDTSATEIGRWDQNGLVVKDPLNTNRRMRFMSGTLAFTTDGGATWTTAIDGDGIRATAIKLGGEPGGHNYVPNSGFEIAPFTQLQTKVWTVTGDWATATSTVNLATGGSDLNLTTATY